jgi:hypothetical protein
MQDDVLKVELDERVQRALGVDHVAPVLDRLERMAIGETPRELVDEPEAEPDAELKREVAPALG